VINVKRLRDNKYTKLSKFEMLESLRRINSNSVINYVGLYDKDGKREVVKMLDDNLRKSNDIGIMLFWER
jgi:hypothetical protein